MFFKGVFGITKFQYQLETEAIYKEALWMASYTVYKQQ